VTSVSEAEFLRWAATRGLAPDSDYPQSAVLKYRAGGESRFWLVPPQPERRPYFIAMLLELLGEWEACYVWRHSGSWPGVYDMTGRVNDRIEYQILRGIGMPMASADVVCFSRGEIDLLITLIFSTTIFGWSVGEDLYIVPDHARQILQTDHHDVIHVDFRDANDVDRWVAAMADEGFDLPDDPPDATFERPPWMPVDE
jgi:hypothetical protein